MEGSHPAGSVLPPIYISIQTINPVSPILLCSSSQALSGWRGSVAAQLFSGLSRDVQPISNEVMFRNALSQTNIR